MTRVLLSSENFIKEHTNIDDNMSGAYISPALRETQDVDLTEILGQALVEKLCELVSAGTIDDQENATYKAILDKCQYVLAYGTIVKIIPIASVKISNFGITQAQDDNIRSLGVSDIDTTMGWYQKKMDSYSRVLMKFVLSVKNQIPELDECACDTIKAHLRSAASSGLWLGGYRGRKVR